MIQIFAEPARAHGYNAAMDNPLEVSLRRLLGAVVMWCGSAGLLGVVLRTDRYDLVLAPWPGIEAWIGCGALFCGGVGLLFRRPMVGVIVGYGIAVLLFCVLAAIFALNGFVVPARD